MITVIAEKPSVAREIARVLKAHEVHEGYLAGNGYCVAWTLGHLISLALPQDYDIMRIEKETLPIIPSPFKLIVRTIKTSDGYKPDPAALRQLEVLRRLFSQCEKIVVATDAGREGELVFRYIYDYLKCQKPFERLWISSLTDKAIREGFENLHPGKAFDNLYHSAKARREADWLVGINASQALGMAAGRGNYSIGRVQTPTLAMICRRYIDNRNFTAKRYFKLQLVTEKDEIQIDAINTGQFDMVADAQKIQHKAADAKYVVVKNIESKTISQEPPLLYDLTSLQREANIRFNISAERTLVTAQMLYEKQLISYPRTGSRYISEDIFENIPSLLSTLGKQPQFHDAANQLIHKPLNRHSVDNDKLTDHHALLITETCPGILTPEEQSIYDLIAGRMLEAFGERCIKESTTVTFSCNDVEFQCKTGKMKYPGWRSVFNRQEESTDEAVALHLPTLNNGEKLPIGEIKLLERKTKPTPLYTEASLLGAMENAGEGLENDEERRVMHECGLGTPATRASVIELLIRRYYIERQDKSLVPTSKGMEVYEIVKDRRIADVQMTGMWEVALDKICAGEIQPLTFSHSIDVYTRQIVAELLAVKFEQPSYAACPCPKCGTGRVNLYPKVAKCNNPDCGLFVFRMINDVTLTDDDLVTILSGEMTSPLKFISRKTEKPYSAALSLDMDVYSVTLHFEKKE